MFGIKPIGQNLRAPPQIQIWIWTWFEFEFKLEFEFNFHVDWTWQVVGLTPVFMLTGPI
jgi:hypothetical protein